MKRIMITLALFASILMMGQMAEEQAAVFTPSAISNAAASSEEDKARRFAEEYIDHINRKNWIEGIEEYLPGRDDAFLKEHTAFRTSFPNYEAKIKRIFVEDNEVVLWLNITANYVENYRHKNSNYSDQLLWEYEAKNQALDWDETWYFNVVEGKFGDKWDSLKDNYAVMKGLEKR